MVVSQTRNIASNNFYLRQYRATIVVYLLMTFCFDFALPRRWIWRFCRWRFRRWNRRSELCLRTGPTSTCTGSSSCRQRRARASGFASPCCRKLKRKQVFKLGLFHEHASGFNLTLFRKSTIVRSRILIRKLNCYKYVKCWCLINYKRKPVPAGYQTFQRKICSAKRLRLKIC